MDEDYLAKVTEYNNKITVLIDLWRNEYYRTDGPDPYWLEEIFSRIDGAIKKMSLLVDSQYHSLMSDDPDPSHHKSLDHTRRVRNTMIAIDDNEEEKALREAFVQGKRNVDGSIITEDKMLIDIREFDIDEEGKVT